MHQARLLGFQQTCPTLRKGRNSRTYYIPLWRTITQILVLTNGSLLKMASGGKT